MEFIGLDWSNIQSVVLLWKNAGLTDVQIIQKLHDMLPSDTRALMNSAINDEIQRLPADPLERAAKTDILENIVNPWISEAQASGITVPVY